MGWQPISAASTATCTPAGSTKDVHSTQHKHPTAGITEYASAGGFVLARSPQVDMRRSGACGQALP